MCEHGVQVVLQVEMSLVSLRDRDGECIPCFSALAAISPCPRFAEPEAGLDFQVIVDQTKQLIGKDLLGLACNAPDRVRAAKPVGFLRCTHERSYPSLWEKLSQLCFHLVLTFFVAKPLVEDRIRFCFIQHRLTLLKQRLYAAPQQSHIAMQQPGLLTELVKSSLVLVALVRLLDQVKTLEQPLVIQAERSIDTPSHGQPVSQWLARTQQGHTATRVLAKSRLVLLRHRIELKCCHAFPPPRDVCAAGRFCR